MHMEGYFLFFAACCYYLMAVGMPVAVVCAATWWTTRFIRRRRRPEPSRTGPGRERYRNRDHAAETERAFSFIIENGFPEYRRSRRGRWARRSRSIRRARRTSSPVVTYAND